MAFPTIPAGNVVTTEGILRNLLQALDNGIGEDRALVLLGSEHITADTDGAAATIPEGTTMIKFVVSGADVHGRINVDDPADTDDYLYLDGQEYVEGPFTTEITFLNFIRAAGTDAEVYIKYYSQG